MAEISPAKLDLFSSIDVRPNEHRTLGASHPLLLRRCGSKLRVRDYRLTGEMDFLR
jgi:hypothetical protein